MDSKKLSEMSVEEQRDFYKGLSEEYRNNYEKLEAAFKRLVLATGRLWEIFSPMADKVQGETPKQESKKPNGLKIAGLVSNLMKGPGLKNMAEIIQRDIAPVVQVYLPFYQKQEADGAE